MKPCPRPSHLLALFAALVLLAACVTASPSPTDQSGVTIVVNPSPLAWKTYTNDELGFSFEFPALYEQEPMLDWGCGLKLQEQDEAGAGPEDPQFTLTFGSDNHLGSSRRTASALRRMPIR